MTNFEDDHFLILAINTPLPKSDDADPKVGFMDGLATQQRSGLRPSLRAEIPAPSTSVVKNNPFAAKGTPSSQRKRNKKRKAEFAVFVDPEEQLPTPSMATPKRLKICTPRTPLTDRGSSTNSTPISSRLPDTPFSSSSENSQWENSENYIPYHQRPQFSSPSPSPLNPTTPSTETSPPPPPPPPHNRRTIRPRQNNSVTILPVSMTPYDMLDLTDWRVASDVIRSAYRRKARTTHPDHANTPEERLITTEAMQRLNAAKDVLLEKCARTIYHRTGKLSWVV